MSARKPFAALTAGLISMICLGAAGCSSSKDSMGVADREGKSGAKLPSWEVSQLSSTESPDIMPSTHVAAGRLHHSKGDLEQAVKQFRTAIQMDPKNVEAYDRLGVVLTEMQSFKAAEKAFSRALELAPESAHVYNNLGFCFMAQQRWADAETALREAVTFQPAFLRAHVNLGVSLARQERFEEAFYEFRQAVALEDAFYNMGLLYKAMGQEANAASAFKAALEINPKMNSAQARLEELPTTIVAAARGETVAAALTRPPAPKPQTSTESFGPDQSTDQSVIIEESAPIDWDETIESPSEDSSTEAQPEDAVDSSSEDSSTQAQPEDTVESASEDAYTEADSDETVESSSEDTSTETESDDTVESSSEDSSTEAQPEDTVESSSEESSTEAEPDDTIESSSEDSSAEAESDDEIVVSSSEDSSDSE